MELQRRYCLTEYPSIWYEELTTPPQQTVSAEDIIDKYFKYNEFDKKRVIAAMEEYRNQPIKFTPERTAKEEAERLVDKYYWIFGDGYLGNQHILCAIADCDNTITALKLRGIDTTYEEEVLTILKGM